MSYRLTYSSENTRNWDRGSTGSSCIERDLPLTTPKLVNIIFDPKRSREIVRGDFTTATPYNAIITEVTPISGRFSGTNRYTYTSGIHFQGCGTSSGGRYEIAGDAGFYFDPRVNTFPENLELETFLRSYANTQALADLRRGYVNIPLLYAERVQTAKMISGRLAQLSQETSELARSSVERYKKTKSLSKKKRLAKDLADTHLEFLFGWLPVIEEVKGAVNLFTKPSSMTITGRGRRADMQPIDTVTTSKWRDVESFWLDRYRACLRANWTGFDRISARTSISVSVEVKTMQQMRNLGFNPGAAAFDLIPLSFLANFVSNVGSYIAAHDPMPGVSYLRGSTGFWRERYVEVRVTPEHFRFPNGNMPVYGEDYSCDASGSGRCLNVTRYPLPQPPDPELFFANNLTVAKALTASSLAIQRGIRPVLKMSKDLRVFRYKGPRPKHLPPIKYQKVI